MKNYTRLVSLLFIFDRLTKLLVMYLVPHYRVNALLTIDLVFNRGISFGLFHSHDVNIFAAVNVLIACVIAMLLAHTYYRYRHGKLLIGEMLIFTGAISNVIDRYVYGGVIDFVALSWQDWHFAVFNVADSFIFCGVIVMLWMESKESWKNL